MFKVPEEFRIKTGRMGSDDSDGNNGIFSIKKFGYDIFILASDGMSWEHVSVSINRNRTPTWEVMNYIKDLFWGDEDAVFQFHPPKSQYVNMHPYVLHLWRPIGKEIPLPDPIMVGIKS